MKLTLKFILYKQNDEIFYKQNDSKKFHRELHNYQKEILSGGYLTIDRESKEILFYGKSEDFGDFKLDDLIVGLSKFNFFKSYIKHSYLFFVNSKDTNFEKIKLL